MGQTVRQSMPFNANHAFVHAVVICAEPHKHMGLGLNDRNTPAQLAYGQLGAVTGCFRPKADVEHQNLCRLKIDFAPCFSGLYS